MAEYVGPLSGLSGALFTDMSPPLDDDDDSSVGLSPEEILPASCEAYAREGIANISAAEITTTASKAATGPRRFVAGAAQDEPACASCICSVFKQSCIVDLTCIAPRV